MVWLNALSNFVALLACMVALVMVGVSLRRHCARVKLDEHAQCRVDVAMAAARESQHWLLLAEKIARVGHWRYALVDQSLTWSDEVFTIFGLAPGGCTPDAALFFSLIAPEDRDRAMAGFTRAIEGVSPFEFTVRVLPASQEAGYVTARGIPEIDEAGVVVALFGVLVDVTAQKQVEEELKSAAQASEIANKALDRLARHDALTRLPNRRFFDEKIALEFKRAAREMQPVGLVMVDLDYFKSYNDHYGHPAGDTCLLLVARAIGAVPQRPADMVARYGGEEIVVMLPNTDLAGTELVADMLVQAVRALKLPHEGHPDGIVTISCGAAVFEPSGDPPVVLKLIERADQALYAAKRGGRNRMVSQAIAA
jgi:diguanylate cyclase (GGDEF)-like protein